MTPLAEFIAVCILAVCPNNELRITDLDGERYRVQSFSHQLWAFGDVQRGVTIYRGEPEFEWITVRHTLNPFRPGDGWKRSMTMYDRNGKPFEWDR